LGKKTADELIKSIKGKSAKVFALTGDLGSGKTTFVQGFAKGLGTSARIISPTFILMRKYLVPGNKFLNFYHVDLYRLEGDTENEVINLGLTDIWKNPENIVVIEWAEKIKNIIPEVKTEISFENLGENKRKIIIL